MISVAELSTLEITVLADLRRWLATHHATSPGIWLVTYKESRGPHITYDDVVDEAISFGPRRVAGPTSGGSSGARPLGR